MTRQLTIDDADVFTIEATIAGRFRTWDLRIARTRDWKGRPGWTVRAIDLDYSRSDLTLRPAPEGFRWDGPWSAGAQPHFATPQAALDAAIAAGAVIV